MPLLIRLLGPAVLSAGLPGLGLARAFAHTALRGHGFNLHGRVRSVTAGPYLRAGSSRLTWDGPHQPTGNGCALSEHDLESLTTSRRPAFPDTHRPTEPRSPQSSGVPKVSSDFPEHSHQEALAAPPCPGCCFPGPHDYRSCCAQARQERAAVPLHPGKGRVRTREVRCPPTTGHLPLRSGPARASSSLRS